MKKTLDELIQTQWKKIFTKLSKPIITTSFSLFSQETAQLIFIFVLFISVSHTLNVVEFSHTLFGHVTVVVLLLYYTIIHPMIGAIFSMLMILYYHSDLIKAYYYESILYKNTPSTLKEGLDELLSYRDIQQEHDADEKYFHRKKRRLHRVKRQYEKEKEDWKKQKKIYRRYVDEVLGKKKNDLQNFQNMEASRISSAYPFTTDIQTVASKFSPTFRSPFFNEQYVKEGFMSSPNHPTAPLTDSSEKAFSFDSPFSSYIYTYQEPVHTEVPLAIRQKEQEELTQKAMEEAERVQAFRKSHCNASGVLMHKDSAVRNSMAEMIFPELQIKGSHNGHPCNPCHASCPIQLSTKDRRLHAEHVLQQRNAVSLNKTSADWTPSWFDLFLPNPVFQSLQTNPSTTHFAKPVNSTKPFFI